MTTLNYEITEHCAYRMYQRGVSFEEVNELVQKGYYIHTRPGIVGLYWKGVVVYTSNVKGVFVVNTVYRNYKVNKKDCVATRPLKKVQPFKHVLDLFEPERFDRIIKKEVKKDARKIREVKKKKENHKKVKEAKRSANSDLYQEFRSEISMWSDESKADSRAEAFVSMTIKGVSVDDVLVAISLKMTPAALGQAVKLGMTPEQYKATPKPVRNEMLKAA